MPSVSTQRTACTRGLMRRWRALGNISVLYDVSQSTATDPRCCSRRDRIFPGVQKLVGTTLWIVLLILDDNATTSRIIIQEKPSTCRSLRGTVTDKPNRLSRLMHGVQDVINGPVSKHLSTYTSFLTERVKDHGSPTAASPAMLVPDNSVY